MSASGEPKVKIPISLPAGDMSGADQAVDKIDGVKQKAIDAAREAQQIADVTAAQVKRDRREAEEFAEMEKENAAFERQRTREAKQAAQDLVAARVAVGVAIATAAKQAAEMAVSALKDFRDLGGELSSVQVALLETAEFAQSPFRTLVEWITGTEEALRDLAQANANAAKQEAIYLDTLKRKEQELLDATKARVAAITSGTAAAIDEETAAYERQLRVRKSLADLDEQQAKQRDAQAIRNGADPNQVAAGAAARQQAAGGGDADQKVVEAERRFADAERIFDAAASAVAAASGATDEIRAKASEAANEAQAAVGQALEELNTVRQEAQIAKASIATEAASQFASLADQANADLTAAAKDAKQALEDEAKEQGENFKAGGKEALKLLTEALADDIITPDEIAKVRTAIAQVANSQASHNAEVLKGFEILEKAFSSFLSMQKAMNARLSGLEEQVRLINLEIRR